MMRYSCTPTSQVAFAHMWHVTDIRPALPTIQVPTAVFCKTSAEHDEHVIDVDQREWATFNVEHIPGSEVDRGAGRCTCDLGRGPRALRVRPRALPGIGPPGGGHARPHARDRPLHRRRRLHRQGLPLGDRAWTELLERHNQVLRACSPGTAAERSALPATASSPPSTARPRAVKCAQAICEAVKPLGLEVRAGCHTGEIELLGADVGGIAVHIGARVAALAGPSEVLVTFHRQGPRRRLRPRSSKTAASASSKASPDRWHLYAVASS